MLARYAAPGIAFLVSVAFWPGISGAATSPRWAIAAVSLGFLDWWLLPFVAVCFVALDFDAAVHWAIVCGALCLGLKVSRETLDHCITFFAIGIACSGGIAIAQWFGFNGIDQAVSPAGLFVNKNFMGEAAVLAFIAAISSRLWWSAVICTPALMMSSSRAAWLAGLIACVLLVPLRWRIWVLLPLCMAFIAAWLGYFGTSETLEQRLFIWSDAIQHLRLFGNGTYDALFTFGRASQLHNDWLQLIYELGLFGLIPLATILASGWNPQYLPFVAALLVVGTFGFPLQMPATAWFAAFVIGHSLGNGAIERRMVLRAGPSGDNHPTANGLFASRA